MTYHSIVIFSVKRPVKTIITKKMQTIIIIMLTNHIIINPLISPTKDVIIIMFIIVYLCEKEVGSFFCGGMTRCEHLSLSDFKRGLVPGYCRFYILFVKNNTRLFYYTLRKYYIVYYEIIVTMKNW